MITQEFLNEIIRVMTLNKSFLDTVRPHLKFHFLPTEEYKEIVQVIFNHYDTTNNIPSIGLISERLKNESARTLLTKIQNTQVPADHGDLIKGFESFIKSASFLKLMEDLDDLWGKSQRDEALQKLVEESKKINDFYLGSSQYSRIFADFNERIEFRRQFKDNEYVTRVPTGIPQLDQNTKGGIEKGTALLAVARSGVGKTTFLRWLGYAAAKRGYKVVHFQAEDTQLELENAYDSMVSGIPREFIERGQFGDRTEAEVRREYKMLSEPNEIRSTVGEITVVAYEQFDSASISDTRQKLIDIGDVDLVIWDYLELFEPGDGQKYFSDQFSQQAKKAAVAKKMINICIELGIAGATVTQASTVPKGSATDNSQLGWNNPNFYISREHISSLKATVDPFSYVVSLNQTEDENDLGIMRIWEEKFRKYPLRSDTRAYRVAQKRDISRFLDYNRTYELFWDNKRKRNKKLSHESYVDFLTAMKNEVTE